MRASPAVSVVVIFLDAARFLREALESVLAQDCADWELLLVDDGSTDASAAIARDFAARDPRVRCLRHADGANHGMGASRALGLAHARGEFVAMLDADDVWTKAKLGEQLALLRAHPRAGLVFGETRFWFGWTGRAGDRARDFTWRLDVPAGLHHPPALLRHAPLGNCLKPSMSGFMARRAALGEIGGFEPGFRNHHEDYAFWVKAFARLACYHAPACWDWCRHHPRSHSNRVLPRAERRAHERRYRRWVVDYLERLGSADPYLHHVRRELDLQARHPRSFALRPSFHWHRWRRRLQRASDSGWRAELEGRLARLARGSW